MTAVWCLWMGIATVVLQMGAFVSPGWLRIFPDVSPPIFEVGLWYWCSNGTCGLHDHVGNYVIAGVTDIGQVSTSWLEYQIEATVGLVAGMVGLILTCVFLKCSRDRITVKAIGSISFLVSGFASGIPAGKLALLTSNIGPIVHVAIPYSLILAAIGAIVAFSDAVLIFILLCKAKQTNPGTQFNFPLQPVMYPSVPDIRFAAATEQP
ncbi:hypothetical protein ScPMuIL_005016 [Solemya velum]